MNAVKCLSRMVLGLVIAAITVPIVSAQTVPFHKVSYAVDSGRHDGQAEQTMCFETIVSIPEALWLRCHFADYDLGSASYVRITSLKDGNAQRLDAVSLPRYRNASAFFNGNQLLVELFVAPPDKGVHFILGSVTAGDPVTMLPPESISSLCNGTDTRFSTSDAMVGRAVGTAWHGGKAVMGTAWLCSNGALLTAGHVAPHMETIEFNVPSSSCSGVPSWAAAEDTYAVDTGSIVSSNDPDGDDCPGTDCGQDWAVFSCFRNSETSLLPIEAQGPGAFLRPTRPADNVVAQVEVTGYGDDYMPLGCLDDLNEDNHTQQTAFGPYIGEHTEDASDVVIEYEADTRGGNSGSPVTVFGTTRAIGVHTDGGCDRPNTGNFGTSFENNALEDALQDYPGPNVIYVDYYFYTLLTGDGSVLRPFGRVQDAFKVVPDGGTVSIVHGVYQESFTISRPMKFTAPVGPVVIEAL